MAYIKDIGFLEDGCGMLTKLLYFNPTMFTTFKMAKQIGIKLAYTY